MTAPIDWGDDEPEQQPVRHRADTITDDDLDRLYARIAWLEHAFATAAACFNESADDLNAALRLSGYRRRARASTIVQARKQHARAEQAEAALTRVRAVLAPYSWPYAEVRARDIRHALDGPPTSAETPPQHLAKGTNAEDCPACAGTNPDYPFICPGPEKTP